MAGHKCDGVSTGQAGAPERRSSRVRVGQWAMIGCIVIGCSGEPTASGSIVPPASIRSFLQREGLSVPRGYDALMLDPGARLTVFKVSFGQLRCATVCAYQSAIGLESRDRIGWLAAPDSTQQGSDFDFRADDAAFFDQEFLVKVRSADAAAYNALRLTMARDPDTPGSFIELLAGMLAYDPGSAALASAIVEHRSARSNARTLYYVIRALTSTAPALVAVRDRAWQLLSPMNAPASALQVRAEVMRSLDGRVTGIATLSNRSPLNSVFEYAALCHPSLLLFRDASYAGEPLWDQLKWQNSRPGGCKWMGAITQVAAGDSTRIVVSAAAPDILGDSIQPGLYYATVRFRTLRPADSTYLARAGQIRVERAGSGN